MYNNLLPYKTVFKQGSQSMLTQTIKFDIQSKLFNGHFIYWEFPVAKC
jgi:hypothetical protein